ncbi:BACON domain-containing protein [Bacteroides sp. 224]|uniref:BACON domain-containing protein n=1 Tax=Bacteroides sp. 224 TaxID=2302936 RepID=UPI0013CF89AF|nr:BACON domain-containing carbohydrate-binding protein [Bacteroides sp. 224]
MKHLFNFLLVAICVVGFSACSSDDENPTKTIEINSGTETQIVYADDTESKEGISFTAAEPWTATVTEKATTTSRAPGASWLRLLFDGTEKYSGNAGTFTFVIELDANYTGTSRSATIVIESGKDSITITVTQEGVTEEGKKPDESVNNSNFTYFIKQINRKNYEEDGSLYSKKVLDFSYDKQMQLVKVDEVLQLVKEKEVYKTIMDISYEKDKINYTVDDDCDEIHDTTVTLNDKGYITSGKRNHEDVNWRVTYNNQDYMTESFGVDKTDKPSIAENNRILTWTNGNLTKMVWNNQQTPSTTQYTTTTTYTDIQHNSLLNVDLNWFLDISETWDFAVSSDFSWDTMVFAAMGYYGKGSTHLIKTVTDQFDSASISFSYTLDSRGLVNQIECKRNGYLDLVYNITYYELTPSTK